MATLVDVFTQTKSLTNNETTLLSSSEDLPKDKPSLFDSLLKTSIENIEKDSSFANQTKVQTQNSINSVSKNTTENIATNDTANTTLQIDENTNPETTNTSFIESEEINLDKNLEQKEPVLNDEKEDNTQIKENMEKKQQNSIKNNSLLDRLILEVKNSNLDKVTQGEQNLSEPLKNIENLDEISVDKDFLKSLDEKIGELKNQAQNQVETKESISNKTIVLENDKIVEVEQVKSILKDLNTNSVEVKTTETQTKELLTNLMQNSEPIIDDLVTKLETTIEDKKIDENITTKITQNQEVIIVDDVVNSKNEMTETVLKLENTKNEEVKKVDQKLSLMDQLIQANSAKDITKRIEEATTSSQTNIEQTTKNSKEIASNIFLADQKNNLTNQMLFNKNEAIKTLENASGIEDIQKSADILDLDATNIEVEKEISKEDLKDLTVDERAIEDRKNILNSILNEKSIRSIDVKNLITNSIEASKALLEDTINIVDDKVLDIQPNLVNSIQARIIGAKQNLTSMMSDMARQMYENYKPPVTAFRMVLNPVDMGTISILMKQDKANGLTINMSVSNIATLELLMENQNMLRNSLVKTFNDSSNFNLDFSQGQDSSNQNSSNSQSGRGQKESNTEAILKLKEENRDLEDKNDYM